MLSQGQKEQPGGAGGWVRGQRAPGTENRVTKTQRKENAGLGTVEFRKVGVCSEGGGLRAEAGGGGWAQILVAGKPLTSLDSGSFSWCCPPPSLHQSPLGDL